VFKNLVGKGNGGLWTLWVGLFFLEKKAAHPFIQGERLSLLSIPSVYQLKFSGKRQKPDHLKLPT
jgi:hypothetical protein